jgi:hypothetical protein
MIGTWVGALPHSVCPTRCKRAVGVILLAGFAAMALAGCNRGAYPYRLEGNPPGQNPKGTPADRTGGARDVPDGNGGGGPGQTTSPADQPPSSKW